MTKSNIKWRLNSFHLILITTMAFGVSPAGEYFILNYLLHTLPVYLGISIIMYLPRLMHKIRVLLIVVLLVSYATILQYHDPNDIAILLIITPIFGYALFIWAGYPHFTRISTGKKSLLLIGAGLSHFPALFIFSAPVMLTLTILEYLNPFFT